MSTTQVDSENEDERLNRKLMELLNELRVALPGVQALFAFLLVLPFSQGFAKVSDIQRDVYAVALACAGIASLLLIAPSAYHRHRWPQLEKEGLDDKREMLRTQDHFAMAGMLFLAVAMTAVVFLVFDVLFGKATAALIALAMAAGFVGFWYVLPLSRRRKATKAKGLAPSE